jgi:hypothetical protein
MPRFVLNVTADDLQAARDIVEQVIEHGKASHGDLDWDWLNQPRRDR